MIQPGRSLVPADPRTSLRRVDPSASSQEQRDDAAETRRRRSERRAERAASAGGRSGPVLDQDTLSLLQSLPEARARGIRADRGEQARYHRAYRDAAALTPAPETPGRPGHTA